MGGRKSMTRDEWNRYCEQHAAGYVQEDDEDNNNCDVDRTDSNVCDCNNSGNHKRLEES